MSGISKVNAIVLALLMTSTVYAQTRSATDTLIPNQTIEIIQNYKPEVPKAEKPEWSPQLHQEPSERLSLQYQVPQQTLSYSYHSVPIKPVALGRMGAERSPANYIKLGYGNLNSLLIDGGAGFVKTDEYETTLHIAHLSQKAKLEHQQSSVTELDAAGKLFVKNHELYAGINFRQRNLYYYGYDHDTFTYNKSDIRQGFSNFDVIIGGRSTAANSLNLSYHPNVSFSAYADKHNANEKGFAFDLPVSWTRDSAIIAMMGIKGNFVQFKNSVGSNPNNVFQITPALHFHYKAVDFHLGANPTWARDWKFSFLPDVNVRLNFPGTNFTLKGGWEGQIIQNTYEQLTERNPFLNNMYAQQQTQYTQVFGGFETAIGQHLSLNATIGWRQWKGLPLFVNDYSLSSDGKQFTVVNESRAQGICLNADARYQFAERFSLSASGAWVNFTSLEDNERAWMEPMLRFNSTMDWQVVKPLHLRIGMDFWDGLYARLPDGGDEKMSPVLDVSAAAEYNVISQLSLFLQANNLFANKYQRWYQYPVYGFNIIGGLRFKF